MSLQNHRRLTVCIFSVKIAALQSLKMVSERIFKSSREQAKTFSSITNKETKKRKNRQRMYKKYLINITAFKTNIHLVTILIDLSLDHK
jgi:hypothetical protein